MKNIRDILSIFWSIVCALLLFYILIRFGSEKEILTLIIGIIGGTIIGNIFGHYFSSTHRQHYPTTDTTTDTKTTTNNNMELENFWVIQSRQEPTLYVAGTMPTDIEGVLEPIKSEILDEAIHYDTEELANQAIATLFDYPNWFGARPPRKPKPTN